MVRVIGFPLAQRIWTKACNRDPESPKLPMVELIHVVCENRIKTAAIVSMIDDTSEFLPMPMPLKIWIWDVYD